MDFEATVSGLSPQGSGIVQAPTGKKYFVPGAWPGDRGRFSLKRAQGNFGEAVSRELRQRSPERGDAPCPHQGAGEGRCGGCPWLGIPYARQLEEKHRMVFRLLARYGISTPVSPVAASPAEWGYRNRVQLKTDGKEIGYVSPSTGELAPVAECGVLEPPLAELFAQVRSSLPREDWRPGEGYRWNFLELETGLNADAVRLNRRLPFRQGNSAQNATLRAWLESRLKKRRGPVLELFCGDGNLTQLGQGREWTAVEANAEGLDRLRERQLPGVRVVRADCYQKGSWHRFLDGEPTGLVLDPPRQGFSALRSLVQKLPSLEWMIYVSCQPSSWVRDVGAVLKKGWSLDEVQPLDLFPQTPHVELLTVLTRRG